jgi:TIGR00370 family protein
MTPAAPQLHPLGDSAITISIADSVDRKTTEQARQMAHRLRTARIPHVDEVVPAYTAVTVFYDALHISFRELSEKITSAIDAGQPNPADAPPARHHSIPVRYDGMDLDAVAEAVNLSRDDVIAIHSAPTYTVDLLGFVPGFAYLSEVDARLELPRREQPRPRVPAGSVAIASRLTGIYPFETPGGWHILGNTTQTLFDPRRDDPSLFRAGDTVKFEPAT